MAYTTIVNADVVAGQLDNPAWVIVDCRYRLNKGNMGREFYETAHIPGAVYADLDKDLASPPAPNQGRHPLPDLDTFRATLGRWGIGKGVQVVAYDDTGGAYAARLWWMLRYLGHQEVAVLNGGWQAWQAAGYPTVSGDEQGSPTTFEGEPHTEMVATLEEVEGLVASGQGDHIIDARDPRRYAGERNELDAVSGHIPGARNHYFGENLAGGLFRTPEQLKAQYQTTLDTYTPDEMILSCGSGVTACHDLLAMTVAGLEGARLFVPSWSGWSSDPARPVETGN